jgi:hypothetical protein
MSTGVLTPREFEQVTAAQLKQQLRTHLNRVGITAKSGLAFLHGEFDPVARLYTLHFHGVTTAEIAAALDGLLIRKWGYVPTRTGADPIKRQKMSNPARQFTYLLKAFWPSRAVRLVDGELKRTESPSAFPSRSIRRHSCGWTGNVFQT